MSLKVWLPGTDNLNNYGLCNTNLINDNVTLDNSGKLGKCMSFNGSTSRISTTGFSLPNTWTICAWVKCNSATSGWLAIVILGDNNDANVSSGIFVCPAQSRLQVSFNGVYNSGISYTTATEWTHLAATFDNGHYSFYINGLLKASSNITQAYLQKTNLTIGAESTNVTEGGHASMRLPFNGLLNDVRIYDHAISPKEIKEISKGLVLHYTLSQPGASNMALNSNDLTLWSKESGMTCVWDDVQQMFKIDTTTRTSSRWGIYQDVTCEPNTIYTFSVDGKKVEKTMYLSIGSFASGSVTWPSNHQQFTNNRQRLSYTFTTGDNHTIIRIYLAVYPTSEGSNAAYYAFPKLEKSDHATPWLPNSADAAYTAMGFNSNVEYDCSGFCNNGTITGELTYSSDTPKYFTCSYFDGVNASIQTPNFTTMINNDIPFTINLWFKKESLGTDSYETLYGGPSGFEMDTRSGSATTLSLYMASNRDGNAFSPFNLNEWYMVTMVSDRTNEYYYVNGDLKKTITAKTMPSGNYFIGAWNVYTSQNYKGLMSDFRIYATALSASDILELYHTPVSITNSGVLMTQGELSEV